MLNLEGKCILISIRKINENGKESFDTYFGKVISYNENTVSVERLNGEKSKIPYDEEIYEVAESGFYELNDGTTYENPDFTARWTVYKNAETAEKYSN